MATLHSGSANSLALSLRKKTRSSQEIELILLIYVFLFPLLVASITETGIQEQNCTRDILHCITMETATQYLISDT